MAELQAAALEMRLPPPVRPGHGAAGPGGTVPRPDWRRQTHFESRGLKLGHGVWDLLYDRSAE